VRPPRGLRVLELSNIIAGPVAARTLAEYGADVIRIDAPAPLAGPRLTMWFGIDVNQGKRSIILDLKSAAGRKVFARLVREADVLIHNFLGGSVPRMGITQEELLAINPDIVCCQVSAWAGPAGGKWKNAPAFDPVLQAATGITSRYGSPDAPVMHGVASCVDYISGFTAALGTLQAVVARKLGRQASRVETSLAMGAQLVQFPFVVDGPRGPDEIGGQQAKGSAAWQAMYRCADGWIFLDARASKAGELALALGAGTASYEELAAAIGPQTLPQLRERLRGTAAIVTLIRRLEQVRSEVTVYPAGPGNDGLRGLSTPMRAFDHPSGYRTVLPIPSWCRSADFALRHLAPAPMPGQHTREVMLQAGLAPEEIDRMLEEGSARAGWPAHRHYLPL
jgi:crotonobetainyl-CoA:carnitine CoA-transferase CaiB-like acyl-CoA transferase